MQSIWRRFSEFDAQSLEIRALDRMANIMWSRCTIKSALDPVKPRKYHFMTRLELVMQEYEVYDEK